jgi:hypothetical protein
MNRTGGVATDLEYKLRDMDAENIDASFIFVMRLFGIRDRELMFVLNRDYRPSLFWRVWWWMSPNRQIAADSGRVA